MKNITKRNIAVMNIQYRYFPLSRFLDDAVENGVENIELWGAAPHFHMEDMTYRDICGVRKMIETRGLRLICFTPEQCVYPINLAAPFETERRRSLRFFEDSIRAAGELGAGMVLVTSGTGYFDDSDLEDAWNYAKDGLYRLGEMAAHYRITLALEILRRDESNLVYDLSTLRKMLRELSHPNIGGMIDTIPMALAEERPKDYLEALGERLVHIHFIDGSPRGHLAWGHGILDMEGYLSELDQYAYQGYLSQEITDGRYYMDPSESMRKAVSRLAKALS